MHCFGITNNSPERAIDFLIECGAIRSSSEVSIVPNGKLMLDKRPKRKFIFIISMNDFSRNVKVLNGPHHKESNVFVFASPLRINEITNCTALDMESDVAHRGIGFKIHRRLNARAFKVGRESMLGESKRVPINYLERLSDSVKCGSLLTPLMTFIYTLPRATHQTPIKQIVAKYLYGLTSKDTLLRVVSKQMNEKQVQRLFSILMTETGESYRSAFKALRRDGVNEKNVKALCHKWNVSDYEMRYIISVIGGSKQRAVQTHKKKSIVGHGPKKVRW